MKNRFLKLFMITALTVFMLVGCGGNETGADNSSNANNEANVNTETDTTTQVDLDKYEETDYYYMLKEEADMDTTYVDGTNITDKEFEFLQHKAIKIKDSINMYADNKTIVGYTKPNIDCLYLATNGDWSMIAFSTEPVTSEGYPNGAAIVRTDELKAAMEEVVIEEETETKEMSDKAKAFFDKIRAGVIEDNKTIEEYGKEYPGMTMRYLEETNSPEGMDCVTVLYSKPDSEEDYATAIDVIRQLVYNQGYSKYYLEYIGETDDTVEFNIYGGK